MSPHFDLTDLRLIVRIAEADSLARGTRAAHPSLPAAGMRVSNLEERMGAAGTLRTDDLEVSPSVGSTGARAARRTRARRAATRVPETAARRHARTMAIRIVALLQEAERRPR